MVPQALSRGRIIVPGTRHQLGTCGLFPPSAAQQRPVVAAGHIVEAKACVPGLLWLGFGELCAVDVPAGAFKALASEHDLWVVDEVPRAGSGPSAVWRRFAEVLAELAVTDAALFLVAREVPEWFEAAETAAGPETREALLRIGNMLAALPLMQSAERPTLEGMSGS